MITWKKLETSGIVKAHKSSSGEIEALLAVVSRNLADAAITSLSDDGRFLMSYSAAYQLSTIAILASGYKPQGTDHHKVTFSTIPVALGPEFTLLSDYLERCRRKRNNLQYDQAGVATASEADELFRKCTTFRNDVLDWLRRNHPKLLPVSR